MPKNAQTTTQLHSSHMLASKVMLKILQARLQQYMNCKLLAVQAGFRKGREITLQTNVLIVKAMVFLVAMYECESWTIKKAEC